VAALAAARRTSVSLEQARQAGLARERAAREAARRRALEQRHRAEEERRQAAERRRQQQSSSSQSSGSSGDSSGGSSGRSSAGSGSSSGTASGAQAAIDYARDQIGKPYVWAADGPDTFDCSGLTMRAWEHGGVSLPHYSVAQYEQSGRVSLSDIRPGDLVFFASNSNDYRTIYHVGLYIGGGDMIEAPYTGENVRISSIYRASLFGAARP
jgi:cell wall-associated NlpC family hydrolase